MKDRLLRILDEKASKREKDANGFLIIKDNPIAKAGVFEYLLSEINPSYEGEDRLVRVYRPFEALLNAKDSFKNKPIKFNHAWVGDSEPQADGAIGSDIVADEKSLMLKADLIIYNPNLIAAIEKGECVELSPAYTGEISETAGRFDGTDYEFTQSVECVNHLAVVESGRSGSDLRIQDQKPQSSKGEKMDLTKFKDELSKLVSRFKDSEAETEPESEVKAEDSDVAAKILAIAQGEGEDADKLAKINEILAVKDSDEEVKAEDSEVETENEVKDSEPAEVEAEKAEDEGEDVEAKIAEIVNEAIDKKLEAFQDALNSKAQRIQDSYVEVSKALGCHFDYAGKSESEIYRIGYEALSGKSLGKGVDAKSAFSAVSAMQTPKFTDSKPQASDSKILKMLENF